MLHTVTMDGLSPGQRLLLGPLVGRCPMNSLSKIGDFNKESLLQNVSTFYGGDKEKKKRIQNINRQRKP